MTYLNRQKYDAKDTIKYKNKTYGCYTIIIEKWQ